MRQKIQRKPLHGVLLLDKPLGLSSNQALQKVKWLLRAEKAGHTGTLDPQASGLLPLCFGAATKFSQLQLQACKTYEATLLLGSTTSTGDVEGEVLERRQVPLLTETLLEQIGAQFTGQLSQIPPMYSALKKNGKALYEYARAGQVVERTPRVIMIYKLNLEITLDSRAPAAIKMVAECSKGTYIRTLGEDIGQALGCGAHLGALRRLRSGDFSVGQCVSLPALEAMSPIEREQQLLPVQSLLAGCPSVTLSPVDAGRFLSGLRRRGSPGQWGVNAPCVQVYGTQPSAFLGSAHVVADELIPGRLLSPLEIEGHL